MPRVLPDSARMKLGNSRRLALLCRFLHEHKGALGSLASMTAAQLGWAGRPVVSVTPDTCAIDALSLMAEKEVAGIGVVSQNGALIGNFSHSDLRLASKSVSPSLTFSTHQSLCRIRGGKQALLQLTSMWQAGISPLGGSV